MSGPGNCQGHTGGRWSDWTVYTMGGERGRQALWSDGYVSGALGEGLEALHSLVQTYA